MPRISLAQRTKPHYVFMKDSVIKCGCGHCNAIL